jgi:bacillithiol biosynthesis deacetylase BshB1
MGSEKLDVIAFGPHPDDVELGCGGTLYKLAQMGYSAGIVDLTEGEMATRGTVDERCREAADAAEILQLTMRINLKIPDANITQSEENRLKAIEVLRKYRPELVFAPYPDDRHPDHIHASRLISESCFYAGVKKIGPPDPSAYRPSRIIYYSITYDFIPSFVVDISEQFETKIRAIKAHRSQVYNPDYDGEKTFIASEEYMEAQDFRARYFGWKAGVRYAEPFWVRETLLVEDLFTALAKNKM